MSRVVRSRLDAARHAADPHGLDSGRTDSRLVRVYDGGSMPAATPRVYLTHPVLASGDECEGCPGSLAVDEGTTLPVIVLGGVPAAGDDLIAHGVGGRWVARKGGGTCGSPTITGTVHGCSGLGAAGLVVEARDATENGTLLGSATCDADGHFTLSGLTGVVAGHDIVLIPADYFRFDSPSVSLAYTPGTPGPSEWSCGRTTATAVVVLAPAAGYHCLSLQGSVCPIPVADTIAISGPGGSGTLTYTDASPVTLCGSTSGWYGEFSLSFAGSGPCAAAASVPVRVLLGFAGTSGCAQVLYHNDGAGTCPGSGPAGGFANCVGTTYTLTCYPFNLAIDATCFGTWPGNLTATE